MDATEHVEIELKTPDTFKIVVETLTRIGIASKRDNKLYQSCHILHKRGKYYILHFKQLFELDGRESNFADEDRGRLNTIVGLLQQWDMVKVLNPEIIEEPKTSLSLIKIIPFSEKKEWTLQPKYTIGKFRS